MKTVVAAMLLSVGMNFGWSQGSKPPVTYAIIGLAHDHANGFLPRARNRPELQLAGIVEPNSDLVSRYGRTLNLPTNLFFPSLEALLARTNIQAVATFTTARSWKCAPLAAFM
jgi:predicted dehydrogenase